MRAFSGKTRCFAQSLPISIQSHLKKNTSKWNYGWYFPKHCSTKTESNWHIKSMIRDFVLLRTGCYTSTWERVMANPRVWQWASQMTPSDFWSQSSYLSSLQYGWLYVLFQTSKIRQRWCLLHLWGDSNESAFRQANRLFLAAILPRTHR